MTNENDNSLALDWWLEGQNDEFLIRVMARLAGLRQALITLEGREAKPSKAQRATRKQMEKEGFDVGVIADVDFEKSCLFADLDPQAVREAFKTGDGEFLSLLEALGGVRWLLNFDDAPSDILHEMVEDALTQARMSTKQ